jgi:hypothetical protein
MRAVVATTILAVTACAHAPATQSARPDYEAWHAPVQLDSERLSEPEPELDQPWLIFRDRPLEGSGGAIHVWSSGEQLNSADLNANFQHIHNLMVGGHGARLVDADISTSAAISSSKLAAYRQIPRAWGYVELSGGVLTLRASNNVTSITKNGAGDVIVTVNYTPTDAFFGVQATCFNSSSNRCTIAVANYAANVNAFHVYTFPANTNTLADNGFSFTVFDDN